jgi:hypothetical protein
MIRQGYIIKKDGQYISGRYSERKAFIWSIYRYDSVVFELKCQALQIARRICGVGEKVEIAFFNRLDGDERTVDTICR